MSVLRRLFDDEARSTLRTILLDRLVPRSEVAFGVRRAAVKNLAAFASLNHDFSRRALRTRDAGRFLLDVLALRIIRACGERTVSSLLHHQILPALRAGLVERLIGRGEFAALLNLASCLAFGITGARKKLPVAPAFQSHR